MDTGDSSLTFEAPSLPAHLIEPLANILADAVVAYIRQYPDLTEVHANHTPKVESVGTQQ